MCWIPSEIVILRSRRLLAVVVGIRKPNDQAENNNNLHMLYFIMLECYIKDNYDKVTE